MVILLESGKLVFSVEPKYINELPKGILHNDPCRPIFSKTNRHIKSIALLSSGGLHFTVKRKSLT